MIAVTAIIIALQSSSVYLVGVEAWRRLRSLCVLSEITVVVVQSALLEATVHLVLQQAPVTQLDTLR